jgi:glycosyltransferase involved in cell wall biosynthesis
VLLVLGYNTALFTLPLRVAGRFVLMNMDGIEWKRDKWSFFAKVWFYINEWFGALASTKLIADHPAIANHLATRRKESDIVTIPYGADVVTAAPTAPVEQLGLTPGNYFLSVGRIEPENSIVEMITAYTRRERRPPFVCVGPLEPKRSSYHARVIAAANGRVLFPGAIYDAERLQALRFHALAYCHGHTVGGTNPSLVEALGAGNAIIARDNVFNRWVAGPGQFYFSDTNGFGEVLDRIESTPSMLDDARKMARARLAQAFEWRDVLDKYEALCLEYAWRKPPPD